MKFVVLVLAAFLVLNEASSLREKRNIDSAKFDEALNSYLNWLTDDQKAQIRTLKEEGKPFDEVQKKVFEFYDALSGDVKTKATQAMQDGCRAIIKELVGDEKANELKTLRESGASKADIKAKVIALMDSLTDPAKKDKAVKYASGCQKIFELEARMKRDAAADVNAAKLNEYLDSYLSWLTADQKAKLKTLAGEGKNFNDLHEEVFKWYADLSGEAKDKAKELMQGGCRSLIKELAGEEKANELKTLRESGASKADIEKKIIEFMDGLTDEDKKQKALKYTPTCKKIFDLA